MVPTLSDLSQKKKAQIKRLFTSKDQLSARLDKLEEQAQKVSGCGWVWVGVLVCDVLVCCV